MSTGSKLVLLLTFIFIAGLIWYYGPSENTPGLTAEDPVLSISNTNEAVGSAVATLPNHDRALERPAATPPPATPVLSLPPAPSVPPAPPAPVTTLVATTTVPVHTVPAPRSLVMGQPLMPQQPAVSETPAGAPTRTYTVSEGDTLSGIAVIFLGDEGGWVRIAEANPSVNPNRLRIGTRLTIPPHQPRQARSRNVTSTAVSQRQHQVEQGESLSSISSHYYGRETMWVQIFEANRAQLKGDPNRLRVGMLLDLPR